MIRLACGVVTALALTSACDTAHPITAGPLNLSSGTGSTVMKRMPGTHWLTFGEIKPCSTTGLTYRLDSVKYDTRVKPLAVQTWIRRVSRADANDPNAIAIGSATGKPPHFDDGYTPTGSITRFTQGASGSARCKSTVLSYVEILTAVKYNEAGFHIAGFTVNYRIGSKHYAVVNHWEYGACGNAYHPADSC